MNDKTREKYDSLEGIMQIWEKLEGSKGKVKSAPSSGGQKTATPEKRYKQSEIREMMMNNPTLYDQNQQMIAQALKEGRVDFDK